MNRVPIIALAAVGVMSVTAAMLAPMPQDSPAQQHSPKGKKAGDEDAILRLSRDSSGQFTLSIPVNGGTEVEFLVDTGADLVAITEAQAEELGLLPPEDEFQPTMQTASGTGYAAPIIIDEMEIAGQTLRDVDAVVVKDLGTNLLGQTALRQLGGIELKGDKMVIRPRS